MNATRKTAADLRAELGAEALLSVSDAARALPGRDGPARAWLRQHVKLRRVAGVECVRWGDVLEASDPDTRATVSDAARPVVLVGMRRGLSDG